MTPEKQVPNSSELLKKCADCGEEKTLDMFYRRSGKRSDKPNSYCRACHDIKSRRWAEENPEKAALRRRRGWLKRYNLTPDEYDRLLVAQGGTCAICKTGMPGGSGSFHVDHDHSCCSDVKRSCGRCVRGLLCSSCNRFLARENPRRLRAAAKYIEDFNRARSAEQRLAGGLMEPLFG